MDKPFVKNWGFSVSNDDQMCVYSHKNSSEWHRKSIWQLNSRHRYLLWHYRFPES